MQREDLTIHSENCHCHRCSLIQVDVFILSFLTFDNSLLSK